MTNDIVPFIHFPNPNPNRKILHLPLHRSRVMVEAGVVELGLIVIIVMISEHVSFRISIWRRI